MTEQLKLAPLIQPPTISEVQSWSWIIRNVFFDKLVATPFFARFTARKSRALQIIPAIIPYLGVYIISEDMTPDGDLNAGEIRFIHQLRLGFSVIVQNNDPVACEAKLDQAFWTIMNTLWRDPYLTNLLDTRSYPGGVGNPDNARIEGVSRGTRRFVYGNAGLNNEMPIGEMQYEATVKYGADYAPIITDDLLQISMRTGVKPGDTPEEMSQRLQTGGEYVFGVVADATPPTVPTGLTATGVSSTQINLAWSPSTDDVGVAGYQVFRGGVLLTTVTATAFSDVGLTPNTSYQYQVKATDAAGNVSGPAVASATTAAVIISGSVVQFKSATLASAPGGNTGVIITLNAPVTRGNSLLFAYILDNGGAAYGNIGIQSFSDAGHTNRNGDFRNWTDLYSSGGRTLMTMYQRNVMNTPLSFQFDFNPGANNGFAFVVEVTGTGNIDAHALLHQINAPIGVDTVTSGPMTTSGGGDLIFGVSYAPNGGAAPTVGTGFTVLNGQGSILDEYKIEPLVGSVAATFNASVAADYVTAAIALKPSSVIVAPVPGQSVNLFANVNGALSWSASLQNPVAPGNAVLICFGHHLDSNPSFYHVKDDKGNDYTLPIAPANSYFRTGVAYLLNIPNGPKTFTVNVDAGVYFTNISICEVAGLASFDVATVSENSIAMFTTTAPGDFAWACGLDNSGGTGIFNDYGFWAIGPQGNYNSTQEYFYVTKAGPLDGAMSFAGAGSGPSIGAMAFKT